MLKFRRIRRVRNVDLLDSMGSFTRDREDSWNLSRCLSRSQDLHWLVCGEFNENMYSFEKVGGTKGGEVNGGFLGCVRRLSVNGCWLF